MAESCHYVGSPYHKDVVGFAGTPRGRRPSAFLAPAEALRLRLAGNDLEPERADDLAEEFGVSSQLIRHQVRNHDLATIVEY